jgi:predicted regulator of Ras-like GTPase activity (Roadblock/LC7/MglB family)
MSALRQERAPGHSRRILVNGRTTSMKRGRVASLSGEYVEAIGTRLKELYVETGAACVVMVDTMGQMITRVGDAPTLDITTIVSLLAASFATTSEMSRQLKETHRTFNLTFHEGQRYDIYASNVASALFLVIIFDREAHVPKIGMIWLYIKRSIQDLLRIAAETTATKPRETLTPDFAQSLSQELDHLFQERRPVPSEGLSLDEARSKGLIRRVAEAQKESEERTS